MEFMPEAEKSNIVHMRDYTRRRPAGGAPSQSECAARRGKLLDWPRSIAPYPGGIDDIPV